jgi:hypothetical protein
MGPWGGPCPPPADHGRAQQAIPFPIGTALPSSVHPADRRPRTAPVHLFEVSGGGEEGGLGLQRPQPDHRVLLALQEHVIEARDVCRVMHALSGACIVYKRTSGFRVMEFEPRACASILVWLNTSSVTRRTHLGISCFLTTRQIVDPGAGTRMFTSGQRSDKVVLSGTERQGVRVRNGASTAYEVLLLRQPLRRRGKKTVMQNVTAPKCNLRMQQQQRAGVLGWALCHACPKHTASLPLCRLQARPMRWP